MAEREDLALLFGLEPARRDDHERQRRRIDQLDGAFIAAEQPERGVEYRFERRVELGLRRRRARGDQECVDLVVTRQRVGLTPRESHTAWAVSRVDATGNVKLNVEPSPGELSTHTRPPCARTKPFTM